MNNTGFKSNLYERLKSDGTTEYAYVTAGTDDAFDVIDDLLQPRATGREGMVLFNRFVNGTGLRGVITTFENGSRLAGLLRNDSEFLRISRNFESEALSFFNNNGNLDGFMGSIFLETPFIKDTWLMHTVMVGTQQFDAKIRAISSKEIAVQYIIWDHFGAGTNDAISNLPGLPSMYWLQHNSESSESYIPYI